MKGRALLLALPAVVLAFGCENPQDPDGIRSPSDPSKVINDGAHGTNPLSRDFFFLPPMVPLPLNNPDFELGKFNNALAPGLRIEICQLAPEYDALNKRTLPKTGTACVSGNPKKTFPAGSVKVVNLPLRENGWWNFFKLPADGFYYVLWDTRSSTLSTSEYYRIKVFLEGRTDALGFADVDPMANLRKFQSSLTGEVIQLVDDVMLPITFRIERGAFCEAGTTCTTATYTNNTPLTIPFDPEGTGSTAGVSIPADALPTAATNPDDCTVADPCPQTVTVNITRVDPNLVGQGLFAAASTLCHTDIPFLQQFKGCYNFSTTPELRRLNEDGDQFIEGVLVAVCFELAGTTDPRAPFAQLYSSSPEGHHPSQWLDDHVEGTLVGALTRDCTPPEGPIITSRSSNPLIQFASSGWRKLKGGFDRVFGVKTAYAVDFGLGGIVKGFSHISPVLRVGIAPASFTDVTLAPGEHSTTVRAKITAEHFHTEVAPGVNNVPVTFAVTADGSNGRIKLVSDAGSGTTDPLTVNTTSQPAGVALNGFASVSWILPEDPGTYTMTGDGPAYGGTIIYTATVPPVYEAWSGTATIASSGSPIAFGGGGFCVYTVEFTNIQASIELNATGGGTATVTANQVERLFNPPCGSVQPAPLHLDHYTSTNVTRDGNTVTATLVPVGNPISATLTLTGHMSADQSALSTIFTWQRYDQPTAPILNWTVVGAGILTRTLPGETLTPALVFTGSEFYTANNQNWVRYRLGVTNYNVYPAEMFAARPDLPPCGLNTNASRTWVDIYNATTNARIYGFCALRRPSDLNSIWFARAVGTAPPAQVYIKLTDRATGSVYTSNNVTPLPPP